MSHLYGWGMNNFGELGKKPGYYNFSNEPEYIKAFTKTSPVVDIACGSDHSIFLLKDGRICSCGSNEFGQLGRSGSEFNPQVVHSLSQRVIMSVVCGKHYSIVLTDTGQVFSWGLNEDGQLGRLTMASFDQNPKSVKCLTFTTVVQIATGNSHTLALTERRKVYSWGSNSFGQLSNSTAKYMVEPELIAELDMVPVNFVSCGGTHSFALSVNGTVFAWGSNKKGQLGLSNCSEILPKPTMLSILYNDHVVYVCCGFEHTVLLTQSGGVFVFGIGKYGCCGHGVTFNQMVPMKVDSLMGLEVTQIVCGSYTTFAFVPKRGLIYSWGFNGDGQLGVDNYNNQSLPQVSRISSYITEENVLRLGLHSGFDCIFVAFSISDDNLPVTDHRMISSRFDFISLSVQLMAFVSQLEENSSEYYTHSDSLEFAFLSISVLNASFLNYDITWGHRSRGPNIDMNAVLEFMHYFSVACQSFQDMIYSIVSEWLAAPCRNYFSEPCFEVMRFFMILIFLPCFKSYSSRNALKLLVNLMRWLHVFSQSPLPIIRVWFTSLGSQWILEPLRITKIYLIEQLKIDGGRSWDTYLILNFMSNLYHANSFNHNELDYIDPTEFYIDQLRDVVNIKEDYFTLYFKVKRSFHVFQFPFIYNMDAKVHILNFNDDILKELAMQEHVLRNYAPGQVLNFENPEPLLFSIHVSRERIVEDAKSALMKCKTEVMRRPLYVVFEGEDAMDYGGVRKEFFMILFCELLDTKYELFTEYSESNLIWFCQDTRAGDFMFCMVGILCGLCIYNNVIVNLPFPPVLYKKILGRCVFLTDLCALNPSLGRGLRSLLDYDGSDFEDVFMLTFQINFDCGRTSKLVDLAVNGESVPVTNVNKNNYVDMYVDYVLNKSVENQFRSFEMGFRKVVEFNILKYFEPFELESLIVGKQKYDFNEWENFAVYDGEYHAHHPVIRMFWEVFYGLTTKQKRQFLLYLTGSDRIPFRGLKSVPIRIQPFHVSDNHLPVVHTCFNILDLPLYSSIEIMREKLLSAIEHTSGFGLI